MINRVRSVGWLGRKVLDLFKIRREGQSVCRMTTSCCVPSSAQERRRCLATMLGEMSRYR